MTAKTWLWEITSRLIRRQRAARAGIVIVLHPGDNAPKDLLNKFGDILRTENIRPINVCFADLSPNPVAALVLMARLETGIFSVACDPETILKDDGAVVNALNIHRDTYTREGLCAVFWIPSYVFGAFADHASNFLDFLSCFVEIGMDGLAMEDDGDSPKFFIPPPADTFDPQDHEEDIAKIGKCLEEHRSIAVVCDASGRSGDPASIVRAYLHQNKDALATTGGAFWMDGTQLVSDAVRESDLFAELALKMGVSSDSLEMRLTRVAKYLRDHPQGIIFYEAVQDPHFFKTKLPGGWTPLLLGGRLIMTTHRKDVSPRDFAIINIGSGQSKR